MGKRLAVSMLPSDVLLQLHQRLVHSNFSEYDYHSAWLLTLGFSISKSAVHRYGKENEDQIRQSVATKDEASDELRMRCLELAHRMVGGSDSVDALLGWVRNG